MTNYNLRRRALKRIGSPVTVTNFDWDGDTDKYGDPVDFEETEVETYALIEMSELPQDSDEADSADIVVDEWIYLPGDIEVNKASSEDVVRATEIEFHYTGDVYKVYYTRPDYNGVNTTLCRRV